MSNYYDKSEAKVAMAWALIDRGWDVVGYHPDESDSYTDYYSPAYWRGIAYKNGYILVVDDSEGLEDKWITRTQTNYLNALDSKDKERIEKLKNVTVQNGATEAEEENAKERIKQIQSKEKSESIEITEHQIGHLGNPKGSIWHLEKDGKIILKGRSLTKFSKIYWLQYSDTSYQYWANYDPMDDLKEYYNRKMYCYYKTYEEWKDSEEGKSYLKSREETKAENMAITKEFEELIDKIDKAAGNLIGDGDIETLEKVEFKKDIKYNEFQTNNKKDFKVGTYFILNARFNYGCYKGAIYQIEKIEGNSIYAYRLNTKLTKTLKGQADSSNRFYTTAEKLAKWIENEAILLGDVIEKTKQETYTKWIKKTTSSNQAKEEQQTTNNNLKFDIKESKHTVTNETIYIVKHKESLSNDDYIKLAKSIKKIGGYYSKFVHGFIFKKNPEQLLKTI